MLRFFLGALVATLIGGSASAATEINVLYGLPWLFKETHETIAREFMAENPGIKVNLLAPAKSYEEVVKAARPGTRDPGARTGDGPGTADKTPGRDRQ